jgi:hypothetical protein
VVGKNQNTEGAAMRVGLRVVRLLDCFCLRSTVKMVYLYTVFNCLLVDVGSSFTLAANGFRLYEGRDFGAQNWQPGTKAQLKN